MKYMSIDMLSYEVYYGPGSILADAGMSEERQLRDALQMFQRTPGAFGPDGTSVVELKEFDYLSEGEGLPITMNTGVTMTLAVIVPKNKRSHDELLASIGRFEIFMSEHFGREVNIFGRSIEGVFTPPPRSIRRSIDAMQAHN